MLATAAANKLAGGGRGAETQMAELKQAALVLTDISGYTRFITMRAMSLLHAEQIITDLLEAVVASAEYPLTISKFEGDAVFLYAFGDDQPAVAKDVLSQVVAFTTAFASKQRELIAASECPCDAHVHIAALRLKSFLHFGEVVFKKIHQFEELAGEEVILIHRLLKNSVPSKEYILLTERFYQFSGGLAGQQAEQRREQYGLGSVPIYVYYAAGSKLAEPPAADSWRAEKQGFLSRLFTPSK